MVDLLKGGETSLRAAQQAIDFVRGQLKGNDNALKRQGIVYALESVSLLQPVLHPGKVICLGLNYRDHAAESGMAIPEYPVLFHKVAGSLIWRTGFLLSFVTELWHKVLRTSRSF